MTTEQLHCEHKQKRACGDYHSQPQDWAQPEQCPAKLSFVTPPHRRAERIKHGVNGRHAGKKLKAVKMEHKGMEDNVAHARPKVAPSERI